MSTSAVHHGMLLAAAQYTGLSVMQLEALGVGFSPCLCTDPTCQQSKLELRISLHVVKGALTRVHKSALDIGGLK